MPFQKVKSFSAFENLVDEKNWVALIAFLYYR